MLSDVRIIQQKQDTLWKPGGNAVPGIRTTFNVGDDGPFSVILPVDGFTGEANLAAIEKLADSVRVTRAHADLQK